VGFDWVRVINKFAPKPDLAVYLDVPPEVALRRIGGGRDLFERADYQREVRKAYLKLVDEGELRLISTDRPYEEAHRELLKVVLAKLREVGVLS